MTRTAPIVPSHLTMAAARKIATLRSAECLLVELGGRLIGILDERALTSGRDQDLVSAWMTVLRLAVGPTTTVARAHALIVQHRLAWLPVAAGTFLVGSVSRKALERALTNVADDATGFARVAA